jgi:cell division protein FtsX
MKNIIITTAAILSAISSAVASTSESASVMESGLTPEVSVELNLANKFHEQAANVAHAKVDQFLDLQTAYQFEQLEAKMEAKDEYASGHPAYGYVVLASSN